MYPDELDDEEDLLNIKRSDRSGSHGSLDEVRSCLLPPALPRSGATPRAVPPQFARACSYSEGVGVEAQARLGSSPVPFSIGPPKNCLRRSHSTSRAFFPAPSDDVFNDGGDAPGSASSSQSSNAAGQAPPASAFFGCTSPKEDGTGVNSDTSPNPFAYHKDPTPKDR